MFRHKARTRTSSAPISLSYLRFTSYIFHQPSYILLLPSKKFVHRRSFIIHCRGFIIHRRSFNVHRRSFNFTQSFSTLLYLPRALFYQRQKGFYL